MRIKTYCLSLVFLLLGTVIAHSQEIHTGMNTGSRVNETYVDSSLAKTMESQSEAEAEGWIRQLHVKTNALGLGMAIANLAVEVDLGKHWSFTLPVYYSAWDYFKTTVKFRTLMVQPEVRYWFNRHNEGWFLGAHFGSGYYNIALDGDYRYQDHAQQTPAIGGGLTIGYRTHLSKNKRWKLEFAVGGGAYDLKYDTYYNVKNGKLVETTPKTYIGVDNASINISYSFNLNKRKK